MARIAGVNIPQNKLVHIGLTYIYGIGDKFSNQICTSLEIPKAKRGILIDERESRFVYPLTAIFQNAKSIKTEIRSVPKLSAL